MNRILRKVILSLVFVLMAGSAACSTEVPGSPKTWIDSPGEGASVAVKTPVAVVSHFFAREGVAEIVLSVNGEPYRRDVPEEGNSDFVSIRQEWIPDQTGSYLLQVQGFDRLGAPGMTDSVSVEVVEAMVAAIPVDITRVPTDTPTPVISETLDITITPTLPPDSTVKFYADPETINAGSCSNLYWEVKDAQRVIFGGVDQPFTGSYQACLCESTSYPLRVINLDGTDKQQIVRVSVTGTCATDTPVPPVEEPADTTPPSVPAPAVPANGLTLSCRSSQNLVWLPSSDDASGVAGYFVKLETQVKPGQWQSAGGYGPVSDKQVTVNVQCGGIYRWMVRAQDGSGNVSGWSAPSTFSVGLN